MSVFRIASIAAISLSTAAFAADQAPATGSQPTTATAPAAPAEKLICRRTPEIGSLIKVNKRCETRAEWRRIDSGARDTTRDMQAVGGSATNQ